MKRAAAGLGIMVALGLAACSGGGGGDSPPTRKAGTLDPTFGQGGFAQPVGGAFEITSSSAQAIGIDAAGRVVVAGTLGEPNTASGGEAVFLRLSANGLPDAAFGQGGILRHSANPRDRTEGRYAFPVARDRTLILTQQFGLCADPTQCPPGVELRRLTAAGLLDGPFGSTGYGPMELVDAARLPDESIVFLARLRGGTGNASLLVRRVRPDGGPDGAFSGRADDAIACAGLGGGSPHHGRMARLASGAFVVERHDTSGTGADPIRTCVTRLAPDGSIDATFAQQGRLLIDDPVVAGARVAAILERGDGGLALVLNREGIGGAPASYILSLTASGARDTLRGTDGVAGPLPVIANVIAATIQADDGIVLAGLVHDPASMLPLSPFDFRRPRLLRLDATGRADTGFGSNGDGTQTLLLGEVPFLPRSLVVGPDGSIFAAGVLAPATRASGAAAERLAIAKILGRAR